MSTRNDAGFDGELAPCSRRRLLAALPGVVILPGVAAACSRDRTPDPTAKEQRSTSVPRTEVAAADVPVGGAKVFSIAAAGSGVVVAQPKKGQYVAYSTVCTHQGGRLQIVKGTKLRCPLHGAEFDANTGDVTNPPAVRPLDRIEVKREGDKLVLS